MVAQIHLCKNSALVSTSSSECHIRIPIFHTSHFLKPISKVRTAGQTLCQSEALSRGAHVSRLEKTNLGGRFGNAARVLSSGSFCSPPHKQSSATSLETSYFRHALLWRKTKLLGPWSPCLGSRASHPVSDLEGKGVGTGTL